MNTDFDIVIVGGGAAGIGAARRLAAGRISTLLIEASDRLGGRARTEKQRIFRLISAAVTFIRPTATVGQVSPKRQVSRSTAESWPGVFSTATWDFRRKTRFPPEALEVWKKNIGDLLDPAIPWNMGLRKSALGFDDLAADEIIECLLVVECTLQP